METLDYEQTSLARVAPARRVYRQASPTELTYIETRTNVVSRSSIAGTVTRDQFDTAVSYLESRYGILRAVVEDGQFVERAVDSSPVKAWLPSDMYSADDVYAKLLNAELDTRVSVYSIHVIAGDDALEVFIHSAHAITDATSLVELHSCLAHFCDCVVRGVAPTLRVQPFPNPVDAAVSQSLASLQADHLCTPPSFSGAFAEIPMRALPAGRSLTHRLERTVICADDMHRISAAAHAHGSSVHSLILAAFALSIRDLTLGSPRQILMRSNLDMRRRLEPPVSTELVFTAITGHISSIPDLDQPLFDIAKYVFHEIHEGVHNGLVFHDYLNYPNSYGSTKQPPVALNISDMQRIDFHWPTQKLSVTGFEFALGWTKTFPNVSIAVYDGTLIANTVYVEEFIDPAIMRAISEQAVSRLLAACQSS
ncbi:phthiocerol/phthiodiolone dimycocerosyl transferase family protein [Paraburkholderia caribensis]|uniref:phthiocerol/phthiodiolone dimycocerosyl transferase family protein n=1 Tax=Paraburkholderia caribensis TaxID=75105 RepID=UPI00071F9FB1|nr:hypothetical protein [Paraburkholderia caribensis]ALP66107.1 hypothetical protein AN416_26895 [Paraburkholderia caribensis]AMV45890.1 hypothetical protein ATN79_28515 [Paraburkholderia caribensis]AUT54963.1 hypothetical protein C2L66_24555 [Paraburkholderia caribensis]CAG9221512.1 conserved hypothetical protein [Paraburkholderia caribensis]